VSWSPPRPGPPQAWVPRPYPQLLRGPAHRWWRSLVSLAVVVGGLVLIAAATAAAVVVATLVGAVDAASVQESLDDWWMLLLTNLGLAALMPVAMLAVWAGHRWRPRWVVSVTGGMRWGWLLTAALVSLVIVAGGSALLYAVDGLPSGTGTQVVPLLLVVALTTPLQAAGEEYLFRGWLTQAIGCLFARALLGAVVAALVSATLFAIAHGGQDPWLFADRFAFGLLASFLVWRTGGLEASIAAHTVNNVVVFVPTILSGGLSDALTASAAPPGAVLLDLLGMAVLGAALAWLAARRGVQRRFVPPPPLVPPPGPVLVPPAHLG
jgi:membrane protease YdiL (CAAX protease family)